MVKKMEDVEQRLSSIDEQMKDIQSTTSTHTRAKENIKITLEEVDKIHEYFRCVGSFKSFTLSFRHQNCVGNSDVSIEF